MRWHKRDQIRKRESQRPHRSVLSTYFSIDVGALALMTFICVALAPLPKAALAQGMNPYDGPCYRAIPAPFETAAPNANAVKTGRIPALTPDQQKMRKDYLRYQEDLRKCLARDVPLTLSPLTMGLYEQLKILTAAKPLISPSGAAGISLLGSIGGPPVMMLTTGAMGVYYTKAEADYNQVKGAVERELRRRLIEAAQQGTAPEQALEDLLRSVRQGKLLGSNIVSSESAQIAADIVADMRAQYGSIKALDDLARKPGKPLSKAQSEKALSQAGKVAIAKRKAERERYKALLAAQQSLYEELKASGGALSHEGLWKVEKERLGGMTDPQRKLLIDRYRNASKNERETNPELVKLAGLTEDVVDGLAHRVSIREKAAAVAESANYYTVSFKGALTAAYAFDVGGPDLKKAMATGTLLADSVFQGASLLANSAMVPTPVMVFQFIGLAGNFASGMNGLFGGGGGPDPFQEQFLQFQQALFAALNALSSQVSTGFALSQERFDQLERRLDVVLVVTSQETMGRIAKCREIMRDFSGRFDGSMADVEAVLTRNARYQTLAGCYDALQSAQAMEENSPPQFQTQVQLGLGAAASQFSPDARALRDQGEDFLRYYWPEATFLYEDLLDERKKLVSAPGDSPPNAVDDGLRPLGSFDLLTRPSRDVTQLRKKLNARVSPDEAERELGPILSNYLGSEGRRDWQLDHYLRVHVEPRSTLTVLGALNATAQLLRVTDDSFTPIPEVMQNSPGRQQLMNLRSEQSYGLVLDYWPVSLHVLAQESLISGDPIAPSVANYLGAGDCTEGTDVDQAASDKRRDARRKRAACMLVREAPLIAANVAMLRLRGAYETKGRPAWALGYNYALGEDSDWALRQVLGDFDFRRLQDSSLPAGKSRWFLKLAGSCDGLQRSSDIGMICVSGKCRPPIGAQDDAGSYVKPEDRLKDRLKACVATSLPPAEDLENGLLLSTSSVSEAFNIAAGLHGRLKDRALVEATPAALRPLVKVNLQEN